mgnify:FL=1
MKTQATNNKQQGNNNSIDAREELLEEVMEIFRGLSNRELKKIISIIEKPSD